MALLWDAAYLVLLLFASPWLFYAAIRQGKYREGYREKLLGRVPRRESDRPCVWFHAVSVGEVNLLHTLISRWQEKFPVWECVISTTTKTGWELARTKYPDHSVFYCPLDFSWAIREALSRVRPDILVLAELELWPNLIRLANRRGCRVAIVNGRLSERSFRGYRRLRPLFAPVLKQIDVIAAQNEEYAARFRNLGAADAAVHVTGSVKFDGAQPDRNNPRTSQLKQIAAISSTDIVFLAGSTQAPEESLALESFRQLQSRFPQLRLIVAPRHINRCDEIAAMLDQSGIPWQRRTKLESHGTASQARILLVDTIGELAAWWGAAHIGFVGGSMGSRGGQNMIEPAAYGVAVSFGPNTRNFRDIVELLLRNDAAVVVQHGEELSRFVERCLAEPSWREELGRHARELVVAQQGAADRTIELLAEIAGDSRSIPRRAA